MVYPHQVAPIRVSLHDMVMNSVIGSRSILNLIQYGGVAFKNPMGSSCSRARTSGFSRDTKRCIRENRSVNRVVFPDCLGPVINTAGKVFMAFPTAVYRVRGSMDMPYAAIFKVQFKYGQIIYCRAYGAHTTRPDSHQLPCREHQTPCSHFIGLSCSDFSIFQFLKLTHSKRLASRAEPLVGSRFGFP